MAAGMTAVAYTGNEVKLQWGDLDAASDKTIWRSTSSIPNPPTGLTDDMIIADDLKVGASGTYYDYGVSPSTSYYYIIYDGTRYVGTPAVTTPAKGEMQGDYVPANLNKINENQLYVNSQNANGSVAIAPVPITAGKYMTVVVFESTAAMTDNEVNDMIASDSNISKAQLIAYMDVKTVEGYNQTLNGSLQLKYIVAQNG